MALKEKTLEEVQDTFNSVEGSVKKTAHDVSTAAQKLPKKSRKKLFIGGIIILILALAGGALIYRKIAGTPEARAKAETVKLVKEVKKLMLLPESDVPAVFDIQDPTLLASQQAFFVGAQKGDKLLVYPQIGKAIIFSPSRHIIINVGPVTFDQAKNSAGVKASPATPTVPAATAPTSTQ